MLAASAYGIVPADAIVATAHATRELLAPASPVPDPPPPYGEVRGPTPGALATAAPLYRYVFRGAVVHGPQGAVTVGRRVVAETLGHTPAPFAVQDGDVWISRLAVPGTSLPAAEHLLCAVPGNHFHFLLDGFARQVLLPPRHAPALLPQPHPSSPGARVVQPGETLAIGHLGWSTSLTSNGGAYHPAILGLRTGQGGGPSDIYVARTDATNRPLRNEAAVQALCESRGFTPVILSGMDLAEQARVFAAARRIVAPHGAGLANLVFCQAGAAVLELMMDQYANLCFRRLAATAGLRWGAVMGQAEPGDPDWVHGTGWSLDLPRLAAVLDDPAFA